ncbi:Uncharacterized membrane protein YcaP, DUF421 family [Ruminococcus sp. YE282]|nr:Uncharacterized membrane protein YcaP, DUF421 family [Ruminococcus bromii]
MNNVQNFAKLIRGDIMLISIIRTIVLYAFVIFAIRIMGKRQISDMQPSELVATLIISNIASLPMQNTSQPFFSGVIPVVILVALEIITSAFMLKNSKFRRLVCGNPIVVIRDGVILQNQMRRLRLSNEDLFTQLRQQDVFNIEDIQYCIVETNGSISVLKKPEKRQPTAENLNIQIQDKKIQAVVINDGEILDNSLDLCQKDENYIYKILKKENKKVSDIFIMTLDGIGNYNIILKDKQN